MMENKDLSEQDLRNIEKRERYSTIQFRSISKIRIVSGGTMEDFDELKKAAKFMFERLRLYPYASINVKCPEIIKEEEWLPTISLVQ